MFAFSAWLRKATILIAVLGTLAEAAALSKTKGPTIDLGYAVHQATITNNTYQLYNFSNIRYAAPPVGNLRFSAPVPPTGRDSTVNDGQSGAICPQAQAAWEALIPAELEGANASTVAAEASLISSSVNISALPGPGPTESEDCLFLDVIVPKKIFNRPTAKACRRGAQTTPSNHSGSPVLVWIYGGGYVTGSKIANDPSGLIQASQPNTTEGMIFVAMNYRLGLYGFLSGPNFQAESGTGNAAFWDQRLALRWVQEYIHLFGGDPNRVTVMGESAGAGSIMHQITAFGGAETFASPTYKESEKSNKTRSLFQQAIPQSPAFLPIPSVEQTNGIFQSVLNYSSQVTGKTISTVTQLRALNFTTLYTINALVVANANFGYYTFGPTVDGVFVPDLPGKLLLEGKYDHNVNLMIGYNSNEAYLFTPIYATTDAVLSSIITSFLPESPSSAIGYIENVLYPPIFNGSFPYTSELGRAQLLLGESGITCSTRFMAHAFGNETFNYEFSVPPALHGQDVQFTFFGGPDEITSNLGLPVIPSVALELQGYITSFVKTGNPNGGSRPAFPQYGENSNLLVVGGPDDGTTKVDELASGRCEWWQNAYYA